MYVEESPNSYSGYMFHAVFKYNICNIS